MRATQKEINPYWGNLGKPHVGVNMWTVPWSLGRLVNTVPNMANSWPTLTTSARPLKSHFLLEAFTDIICQQSYRLPGSFPYYYTTSLSTLLNQSIRQGTKATYSPPCLHGIVPCLAQDGRSTNTQWMNEWIFFHHMDGGKMRSGRGNSNPGMEKHHKDMEERIAWRSEGYTDPGCHKRENTFGLGKCVLHKGGRVKKRIREASWGHIFKGLES